MNSPSARAASRTGRMPHLSRSTRGLCVAAALLLLVSPLAVLWGPALADRASLSAPSPVGPRAVPGAVPLGTPAATVFQPPCYKIDTSVCVSIANATETNIIPPAGSFVSTQEPNASTDLILIVKAHDKLDWNNAPKSGPNSPVALNVTARLWNGDPYYSVYDGTVWHANSQTIWYTVLPTVTSNLTYPYWYSVTFFAHGQNNAPNFFPGMTVNWWIYLTYNTSANATNQYSHHQSPVFQFTYSGAWPYSPYPGAGQYVGSSATFEDINVSVNPFLPNFNDSVKIQLNTTQADVLSNATIGPNSYVDVSATSPNGSTIASATLGFPVSPQGGFGAVSTSVVIPPTFTQLPGSTVTYVIAARDMANNLITTPAASFTVGGNGSFLSGLFPDDLTLFTSPKAIAAEPPGVVQVTPGQTVNLTLVSQNPGSAISAAEAVYTLSYPLLHETVTFTVPLHRITSVQFVGSIPGMPIGSFVNFTIDAWDFTQRLEISPVFGYFTPDLTTQVPTIPGNASFFYVFVFDNGSGQWVSGAQVQIQGYGGVFNSITNTTAGVAYPNETSAPFTPLLLAANFSYHVVVTDPYFVPSGRSQAGPVNATVLVLHAMSAHQTLVAASTYQVVQEANAIIFWLNATPPPPLPSPSNGGGAVPLPAILGTAAAFLVMFPLARWWQQIRQRRKAEERRVTL